MALTSLLLGLSAVAALVPVALVSRAPSPQRTDRASPAYWGALALAVLGPGAWVAVQQGSGWRTGVAAALWLGVAVSITLFALLACVSGAMRRLTPILAAYLVLIGVVALVWEQVPERPLRGSSWPVWLEIHIAVALIAYGTLTLAAVAGIGAVFQERALRTKNLNGFTRSLPSIAEGERLQTRLLIAVEGLLALTLVTGAVVNRIAGTGWLTLDHKTVLSLLAFAVIGALLVLHFRLGLSGRRAARFCLMAYLLLTLAYPGVKFVTDVVIGRTG